MIRTHSSTTQITPLGPALEHVMHQGKVWSARQQPCKGAQALSSGYADLDKALPQGGWQPGQLCEMYPQGYGCGDMHILLPTLATLSQQSRWIMLIAPPAIPYSPALSMAGIDVSKLLMVHPKNHKEALWCVEEGLRSGHCSAVLGWLPETDSTAIRRLQLACESQQSLCWIWPSSRQQSNASAAPLRLQIRRESADQAALRFVKRRGLWPSEEFTLSLNSASLAAIPAKIPPSTLR